MKYTDLLELCKALQARNSLLTEASAQVVRGVRSGNWKSCHEDVAALAEALAAPVDPEQSMLAEYLALQEVSREADQLRVQLAGCSVAALGGSPQAVVGNYGWSPAYQDVVELRKLYEAHERVAAAAIPVIDRDTIEVLAGIQSCFENR